MRKYPKPIKYPIAIDANDMDIDHDICLPLADFLNGKGDMRIGEIKENLGIQAGGAMCIWLAIYRLREVGVLIVDEKIYRVDRKRYNALKASEGVSFDHRHKSPKIELY